MRALLLASGDSLIGLVIFLIIAAISSLSKMLQKGRPDMPEEEEDLPRPRPPVPAPLHRPPAVPPPIVIQQQPPRQRPLTEDQVQEVLRRVRVPAQRPVTPPAPPVVRTSEPATRRIVRMQRNEPELPSAHPEPAPHEVGMSSIHAGESARETTTPSARPSIPEAARPPEAVVASRALGYRSLLRNRSDVRRAIILRELLGPPLALRSDW